MSEFLLNKERVEDRLGREDVCKGCRDLAFVLW